MQNIHKKLLSILLTIIMIVTALPMTASAEDTVTVIEVSNAEELTAACNTINDSGGTYTIRLTDNITGGQLEVKRADAVVTLIGNGKTINNIGTAVYVSGGATVTLGDGQSSLTLQGDDQPHTNTVDNDNPGLIDVLSGSACTMNNNVTLKDHRGNNYLGGGVTVEGGSFTMNGGTIDNCGIDGGSVCYGGGVAVFNSGAFTMNGGTITNCYVTTDYTNTDDPNHLSGLAAAYLSPPVPSLR